MRNDSWKTCIQRLKWLDSDFALNSLLIICFHRPLMATGNLPVCLHVCVTSMIFLGRVGSSLWRCSQWEMSSWNTSQATWATALFPNWTKQKQKMTTGQRGKAFGSFHHKQRISFVNEPYMSYLSFKGKALTLLLSFTAWKMYIFIEGLRLPFRHWV